LWEQDVLRTDSFVFGFLKNVFRRPLLCSNEQWEKNKIEIAIRRYRQTQNQLKVSVPEFEEILPCMCKLCEGNHQDRGACPEPVHYDMFF
jgi:hypothetical protein